jgi:hypothetical protein
MSPLTSKLCALFLALALVPGAVEILESAVHLVREGHLAHAAPDGDHHDPGGPEHGCTPISHLCGCHASLSFVHPKSSPRIVLRASLFREAPAPVAEPPGFWPSIDHPPQA